MKHIIVGGTHGLGWEVAQQLRQAGEETFVTGRSYDQAVHGDGMRLDLASGADAQSLAEWINQQPGPMHFYWISGYGYNGDFATQEAPEKMAAVNFGNVLPAAQAAFRKMLDSQESTRFVVVSSTTGFKARKDEAVYAGTKHAQVGFTRSLGLESERLNASIRVALFMPGGMQTPFWSDTRPAAYDEFLDPAKVARRILDRVSSQKASFYEEVIERGSL